MKAQKSKNAASASKIAANHDLEARDLPLFPAFQISRKKQVHFYKELHWRYKSLPLKNARYCRYDARIFFTVSIVGDC